MLPVICAFPKPRMGGSVKRGFSVVHYHQAGSTDYSAAWGMFAVGVTTRLESAINKRSQLGERQKEPASFFLGRGCAKFITLDTGSPTQMMKKEEIIPLSRKEYERGNSPPTVCVALTVADRSRS